MSALLDAAPLLRCPRCAADVTVADRTLRCATGHSFDVAKQGYVNLLSRPPGAAADDAAMVAARNALLDSGLYSPLADALTRVVHALDLPAGGVLDVGAGTGYYTAAVLETLPNRAGVALDLSAYAARRAARAHPRLASLVGDVWAGLPVRAGAIALVLDVFAPRNAEEFARVLAPGGAVVLVTPRPEHLGELVAALGMPQVDPRKAERLAATFAGFAQGPARCVRETLSVDGATAASLARMGPAAHHVAAAALEHLAASESTTDVTLSVDVAAFVRP
ncbi:putative RNA methyltransferase [Mobilicoccus massiliensis]|uniref:putative RNA methyltransferase n=1 Tax=Mobilicoccus massiliensis TaxID=1522310 RepID=UPI00058DC8C5|nr:methyltransferase domain-containing protein [Mobilicoccus massiliensis]